MVSAQRHLVVGELQDVQDLSLGYGQLLLLGPLDLPVGVHHHGVQHLCWPFKLGEERQGTVSVSVSLPQTGGQAECLCREMVYAYWSRALWVIFKRILNTLLEEDVRNGINHNKNTLVII